MSSLVQFIQDLGEWPARLPAVIRNVLDEAGRNAAARMRTRFVAYPTARFTELNVRRGEILQAIGHTLTQTDERTSVEVGVLSERPNIQQVAHVQEEGQANIQPVRAQKMAIPVGQALNADGVRRFATVRDAAREFTLFTLPNVIVGRPIGGGAETVLFVRREAVTVPPRPFVTPQLEPMVEEVEQKLPDAITGAL